MATHLGELAVLLEAGLTLDRALAVCVENIDRRREEPVFAAAARAGQGGRAAVARHGRGRRLLPADGLGDGRGRRGDGRLDRALRRLAETLERAEALRQTMVSALVYPAMLMVVATGVILMMLLLVVPQFEGLFADAPAPSCRSPPAW